MSGGRASWSGQLAFVLAAAASAIGLGNLWRFPYLAARYGGGVFIAVYLAMSLTLGVALLITEIALGRRSRQSQLTAFGALGHPRWVFLGVLSTAIPLLLVPYYNVIGGWVVKYFAAYAQMVFGGGGLEDPKAFFETFVSAPWSPFVCMLVFTVVTCTVIAMGVKNGIEKSSAIMMPALLVMAVGISLYVAFLPGAGAGIRYYLVPDFSSCDNLGKVALGALGQMFFSLSLAMGIMVTYGSYMRKCDSIQRSAVRIVVADTVVAVLSGFMIIPVVVMFAAQSGGGRAAIDAGPGLMFVTLPRVFASLGAAGPWLGLAFFALVLFAALTSAISMSEACVAAVCDFFKVRRGVSVAVVFAWCVALGSVSAFGYGRWASFRPLGMPALDFFDNSMNILMPVAALLICVFVGWAAGARTIVREISAPGSRFGAGRVYRFMVRWFAPFLLIAILVSEICRSLNIGGWSI